MRCLPIPWPPTWPCASAAPQAAQVEDEVIIAAGSLVPPGKRLVSGFLYLGNPVRQARALTEQERGFFRYSANNYVRLKDQYLLEDLGR